MREKIFFRKPTNSNIYLNWTIFHAKHFETNKFFSNIIETRVFICSSKDHLFDQSEHYKYLFEKYSNLPRWVTVNKK